MAFFRKSFSDQESDSFGNYHDYISSTQDLNTLGFPTALYVDTKGPASNSTNTFVLHGNDKKAKRNKRNFYENKKATSGKSLSNFVNTISKE